MTRTRVSRLTLLPGPRPATPTNWLAIAISLLLVAVILYYAWLVVLLFSVGFTLFILIGGLLQGGIDLPLTNRPATESICTFVRALPYRELDPEVIRAVYEELADCCWLEKGRPFPLRPTDSIQDDLKLDEEDFDFDVVENIAYRTRRSLVGAEQNPWYDRVNTVGDLVSFFNAQPKQSQ